MVSFQPTMLGTRHMCSAGHYLAARAGFEILEAGGNAVDAGVAAGMSLAVLQSDIVNVGGVAPMIFYLADRQEVKSISGLGWWPKAADINMFISANGGAIPHGVLRSVIPAAPGAWTKALSEFGTMSFAEVAQAPIKYARDGFSMHPTMQQTLTKTQELLKRWPQTAEIYLPGGKVPEVGDNFIQSDLAKTLQYMADEEASASGSREDKIEAARKAFYEGDPAQAIVKYHKENDGLMTAEDLKEFRVEVEEPVTRNYFGFDIYTCQPWCQGPVLLQMMSLMDGFDLKGMGHNSADYIHTLSECIKLAFADRERYYGDPRFVDVPLDYLLSEDYAAERRKLVNPERAYPEMPPFGAVPGYDSAGTGPASATVHGPVEHSYDTSYACAIDKDGNAFSITPSDNSSQTPIIPGLGCVASGRGSQNWAVPEHASCIAPGKRPRLTPNPALAIKEGKATMPFGTPGGDVQCQAMTQAFLNVNVFGMEMQEAIEAPRFATYSQPNSFEPHESDPGRLKIESRISKEIRDDLAGRGHVVEAWPELIRGAGAVCAIYRDEKGRLFGAADPRRTSGMMGW
ncbi:MAG: gamma-glutamyltransferase family protein [Proteobacteria bacterium]|nr:gamma-glutamyltransferase family protein [Pseudomonadota bacterium]